MGFYDQSYLVYVKAGSIDLFFGPILDLTGPDFNEIHGKFGDDLGFNFVYSFSETIDLHLDIGTDVSLTKGFTNVSSGLSVSILY